MLTLALFPSQQGGAAIISTSLKGKTRAQRLSDLINLRRFIQLPADSHTSFVPPHLFIGHG